MPSLLAPTHLGHGSSLDFLNNGNKDGHFCHAERRGGGKRGVGRGEGEAQLACWGKVDSAPLTGAQQGMHMNANNSRWLICDLGEGYIHLSLVLWYLKCGNCLLKSLLGLWKMERLARGEKTWVREGVMGTWHLRRAEKSPERALIWERRGSA